MTTRPNRIINVHGHLRHDQDIPARIKNWQVWNVERFVCLCLDSRWSSKGYYTNEDYLANRSKFGEIIIGFASVGIHESEGIDGAKDIERYKNQGFSGLKFHTPSRPLSDEIYFPIYETAQALNMPMLIHTGYVAPIESDGHAGVDSMNMRPYTLDRVARTFPNLKIIGAHLGSPHHDEALQMIHGHPNIYFDFSGGGGSKRHVRKILSAMLPHPGLATNMADPQENPALSWFEKLCFGTDNPEPDIWVPASLEIMDKLEIDQPRRDQFFYGNAASILGIE